MLFRTLTVAIPDETAGQLDALARDSYRRPRDQAAILLVDAVKRAARRRPPPAAADNTVR